MSSRAVWSTDSFERRLDEVSKDTRFERKKAIARRGASQAAMLTRRKKLKSALRKATAARNATAA